MLIDHVRIRAAAARLEEDADPPVEMLHDLGTMLERHVRLEEREVFPLIEAALPEAAAERLVETVLAAERGVT
jgi:hemerythrin-like domain-containing protein